MLQAQPGTAQEIPFYAKMIILFISLVAVILTAAWGKIIEMIKGIGKKKAPVAKEEK